MRTFEYEASALDGRRVDGRSWAATELELDRELEARGLTLLKARRVAANRGGSRCRVPSGELLSLTTQLSTVLGAGVRLVEGLQGIGPRMRSPQSRRLVEDLVAGVQSGASLSEAMDRHASSFPEIYRASVRAGESAGALDTVLARLARYLEWSKGMRATTLQALIYPAILAVALTGLVVVLIYFVLPKIVGLFPGGRASLPAETRTLLALSDFLTNHWLALLAAAVAGVTGFVVALKRPRSREFLHRAVLRIPKFGDIAGKIATSRFASTASILQDAGCDVYKVLNVAGQTCGNAALASAFTRAANAVRRGETITQALEREPLVDPLLVQMISVGEKSGELDRCLSRLVDYYDDEIPRAVKRFLAFLEPAMMLSAALVVAFILMAALMPIFSLYDKIG
ncbi:MAG: type II secretion system F family protein [Planctomycetes bacterium]|nr:type II secretion system F family protein [Planctomycetota bacterium]